jgi:hypothetical protein
MAIGLLVCANAYASIIFQDNFNAENGGTGALNYNSFANWAVSQGTVDLIGGINFFDFYPGNGLYVDLDGSTSAAGLFETQSSFLLQPGAYTLEFLLGGSQRGDTNLVTVALGSLYNDTFTVNSSDPLALRTIPINVATPTSAILSFQNAGGDNVGAILDNVKISTIPEPASLSLFGLGILGLFGLRRKSK